MKTEDKNNDLIKNIMIISLNKAKLLGFYDDRKIEIFKMRFLENKEYKEIASKYQISESRAMQLAKSTLRNLMCGDSIFIPSKMYFSNRNPDKDNIIEYLKKDRAYYHKMIINIRKLLALKKK